MSAEDRLCDVTVRCAESLVATILQVLGKEVALVGVTPVRRKAPAASARAGETRPMSLVASRYVGGRRLKGISGEELLVRLLREGPKTMAQLQQAFVDHGFAAASVNGAMSGLKRQGIPVAHSDDHRYAVAR